ncbi:hypothetical protein L6E12_17845 [Actinokineospora sp. PR83]|uniref:hypothetical protein n=1 Tax=Actinokineospora sp. PR83 TaxID=2884908 RepID=UPI001F489D20|nr:hypothetical protein [Actinokineospora sp. PR83]MCG8917649.1 hypothetical protein [Actinokineospora sp. PR83]
MFPLDPVTIERLAEVIVDDGGAYERSSWKLTELFKRAGWKDVPDFYGYRGSYVRELIEEHAEDRHAVERLIRRICDPLEYGGEVVIAETFRAAVNDVLRAEGLTVSLVAGRPVVGSLLGSSEAPHFAEPTDLHARIAALLDEPGVVDLLAGRAGEARICERNGAYTLAIIGIGSFIEGLLLAVLTRWDADCRENGFRGGKGMVNARGATLEILINCAHDKGFIQLDAKDFSHKVREYRNFIHPNAQLTKGATFDEDSVMLCWGPVQAIMNDLEAKVATLG